MKSLSLHLSRTFVPRATTATCAAAVLVLATSGCMSQRETMGTVIGGVAGGVVGNQFGGGTGKTIATALGAVIGATVGNRIGASMDQTSKDAAGIAAQQALDGPADAGPITWSNPDNAGGPAQGRIEVTREGQRQGRTCREYRHDVMIGGREEQIYGTACQDANGDWQPIES